MVDDPFHQKTRAFLTWFRSQPGTTFHNDIEIADLRHKGAGRGVIAMADIPADTVLFTIPRAIILSEETSPLTTLLPQVFNPPAANHCADDDDDHDMNGDHDDRGDDATAHDSWTTLILILIHAYLQGPSSQWAPYLAILPQGPADFNTPMFWTSSEISELQASPVVDKIGRAEAETMVRTKILPVIRAHPDVFFPATTAAAQPSDAEIIALAFRMGSVIMAYAFDLDPATSPSPSPSPAPSTAHDDDANQDGWEVDSAPATDSPNAALGMVPLADLFNADAAFNAHIAHGPAALTATTLRPVAAGDEILNYYGPLGTGELVRRYGYATPACRRWDLVDLDWPGCVLPAVRAELAGLSDSQWERTVLAFRDDDDDDDEEEDGDDAAAAEAEESILLEYPAADPDAEGRVAPVTAPADVPAELSARIKALLQRVKAAFPALVPNKNARDRIVYSAVGQAVEARAREYATTLEEDEATMATGAHGWDARRRMAFAVRMGEKRILREVGQSVKRRLAVLSLAERDGDGTSAKRRRLA